MFYVNSVKKCVNESYYRKHLIWIVDATFEVLQFDYIETIIEATFSADHCGYFETLLM